MVSEVNMDEETVKVFEIFADGSSEGTSTGCGGWGAIIRQDGIDKEISGFFPVATNNQMELMAIIKAFRCLPDTVCDVVVCTDSQYVKNGITDWIKRWKRNGWINSDKEPVKNREHWEALDLLVQKHRVEWMWVKGHRGHIENERCDRLAKMARDKGKLRKIYSVVRN